MDGFVPLMNTKDEVFRAAVVKTIARISLPEGKDYPTRRTAKAIPAMIAAYRSSLPGLGRDELSAAICSLAPANQWKELTGNPSGVCVCLRDLEREGDTVSFWLSRPAGVAVYEHPTLVLEKLGAIGFVTETKSACRCKSSTWKAAGRRDGPARQRWLSAWTSRG